MECQTVNSDHYIGPRGRKTKTSGKTLSSWDCYIKELQLKIGKLANKIQDFPLDFVSFILQPTINTMGGPSNLKVKNKQGYDLLNFFVFFARS